MRRTPFIMVLLMFLVPFELFSQYDANDIMSSASPSIQYGFSFKINVELQRFTHFRLALGAGIGKKIENVNFVYPSFHSELQIYNGGIGSPLKYKKKRFYVDFVNSLTLNFGLDYRTVGERRLREKFTPLYYFTNFSANPLQNPYYSSLSIGSNYIITNDPLKEAQLVGLFNFNIARTVQVSYLNDGGPIMKELHIGDRFDRYLTGGLYISYHGNLRSDLDLVELSFYKFTGYIRYAFELASHLNIDYISYRDSRAYFYNQNRYRLNISSQKRGLGISASIYNVKGNWDIQNLLHEALNAAYHPPIKVDPSWGVGVHYNYAKFYSE